MKSNRLNLFEPAITSAKQHPNFINMLHPRSSSVRLVLEKWAEGFVDRDGKFVKEFQTTFNSSFWELYLFAVLKSLQIEINFSFPSPDFLSLASNLSIEAVCANHAHDDIPEWEKSIKEIIDATKDFVWEQSTIRLSNAFLYKVNKYRDLYSQQQHMKGRPFIIAISNYTKFDFFLEGDVPMQRLLIDPLELKSLKKKNGADVPLGLFRSDKFSDISAVLYSSLATFGKARALSDDDGKFLFKAIRIKDNLTPILIEKTKQEYIESLCDGLRLFVNPYAKHPINLDNFADPGIRTFLSDKNGDYQVSCHKDGDLCMRFVQGIVAKS